MNVEEMNSLRPGQRIRWRVKETTYGGTVQSVWRNNSIRIKWDSDNASDEMPINADNARYLEQ